MWSSRMENLNKIEEEEGHGIEVSHITVRQSISTLVLKLIAIDILTALFIIFLFSSLCRLAGNIFGVSINPYGLLTFIILALGKIVLTIFVTFQWLFEFYEIRRDDVIHYRGVIITREDRFEYRHIGSLKLHQSFLGRLLNYGHITLYDWELNENEQLYLIHNPEKYYRILKKLLPEADTEKHVFRE